MRDPVSSGIGDENLQYRRKQARFFTSIGEKPGGMHRYACGMHHLMHTFDPSETLGIQGI